MLLVVGAASVAPSVTAGSGYDGVVELAVTDTSGSIWRCSGSLLSSGRHILTAAHCLTNDAGSFNTSAASASFDLIGGRITVSVAQYFIHSAWDGNAGHGNDVAILELASVAPANAERYDIYRATDEVGKTFTVIGYGATGTGARGEDIDTVGTKRSGQNRLDAYTDSNQLVYDFDNGLPANDALGVCFGLADNGLGTNEASAAHGDSGGPGFIGTLVAGITSYGDQCTNSAGTNPDVLPGTNFSFGELDVVTRVSAYAGFIDSKVGAADDIVLDMSVSGSGNDGNPDAVEVRRSIAGTQIEVRVNGRLAFSDAVADVLSLTVQGSGDADTLFVDFANGNPIPAGGIVFNGGGGTDRIQVSADSNITIADNSLVVVGLGTITLSSVERAMLSGGPAANVFDASTFSGPVTLDGGAGNDTLTSGPANDSLVGGDGNDSLTGKSGDDSVSGGAGNDAIFGGTGNDWLSGDDGNDYLSGYDGDDTLFGGLGADEMLGLSGNDSLVGGSGADTLTGGVGNDTMAGEGGNDVYSFGPVGTGAAEIDTVIELAGGDTDRLDFSRLLADDPVSVDLTSDLRLAAHTNRVIQTGGTDRGQYIEQVTGGAGNDIIVGNFKPNLIYGGAGNDTIRGGSGADTIDSGTGNDYLAGEGGTDSLIGGDGNDSISGGDGNDTLSGGLGADTLAGEVGNDSLLGGDGDDSLDGALGTDTIDGGLGTDRCAGGEVVTNCEM